MAYEAPDGHEAMRGALLPEDAPRDRVPEVGIMGTQIDDAAALMSEMQAAADGGQPRGTMDRQLSPQNDELQFHEGPATSRHTVVDGETLRSIAEQRYGAPDAWRRIFDANQDKLDSPDMLYPGQDLAIP